MSRILDSLILATGLMFGPVSTASALEPLLIFRAGKQISKEYHPADLKKVPGSRSFYLHDSMYGTRKHYSGVPLLTLMKEAYGDNLYSEKWSSIAFVGDDGYETARYY